jgi:hypothetical protein
VSDPASRALGYALLAAGILILAWVAVHGSGGLTTGAGVFAAVFGGMLVADHPEEA